VNRKVSDDVARDLVTLIQYLLEVLTLICMALWLEAWRTVAKS
jgi:hypothetical protein